MKKYLEAEGIQLVYSGKNYFDVLEKMIDESLEIIHFQTYIFNNDNTGKRIIDRLKKAAQRKVQVFLMVDAYGSFPFSKDVAKELSDAGVYFRLYSPLFSSESIFFGRRLHHKIIVVDKKFGLTGGLNIADKYNTTVLSEAWLDYAVLTTGKVCEYLHLLCEQFYKNQKKDRLNFWEKKGLPTSLNTSHLIRFRRNDWIKSKNEIHKSYMEALIKAESSITLVASYFLPGTNFRKLLRDASKRGVIIKIILAGKSDINTLRLAENYLYDFFLDNNIQIYLWKNSVMHGKAMVVDDTWATVGSYNLNFLSHYISIELNTDIIDQKFISTFSEHLNKITTHNCIPVILEKERKIETRFQHLKMKLAYTFYRGLMNVMMIGRKYRKRKHS